MCVDFGFFTADARARKRKLGRAKLEAAKFHTMLVDDKNRVGRSANKSRPNHQPRTTSLFVHAQYIVNQVSAQTIC
jgi:hypothetical protein